MKSVYHIGIVGSGMAGLSAAHTLRQQGHAVTLLERLPSNGLSAHSHFLNQGHIDAPLRVMNPVLWRQTLALATSLGIRTYPVHTDMACTWLESGHLQRTWLQTKRLPYLPMPIPAHPRFAQALPALGIGMYRFKRALQHVEVLDDNMDLGSWLSQQNLPPVFWHGCVVPVLLTLCTCDVATLLKWPAKPLLHFCDLMLRHSGLVRMEGGTHGLARALQQGSHHISHGQVTAVWQQEQHAHVRLQDGQTFVFDHVIVATASQHAHFLDETQFATERSLLLSLPHSQGTLINHTDTNILPKNPRDWATLNYAMSRDGQQQSFTVWLNPVERSLHGAPPVFQTWQALQHIRPEAILSQAHLSRSVCTPESLLAVQHLRRRQQLASPHSRRVWLCGSWQCEGLPILESAVTSALDVCQKLSHAA